VLQREEKKEIKDNPFCKKFFYAISTHDSSKYWDRVCKTQILSRDLEYRRDRLQDGGTRLYLGYLDESSSAYKSISAKGSCVLYLPAVIPARKLIPDKRATFICKRECIRAIVPLRSVCGGCHFLIHVSFVFWWQWRTRDPLRVDAGPQNQLTWLSQRDRFNFG